MSREEDMFMFPQEDIDHRGDGYTEMTDTISITSITEVVLQDLIAVFIMEMADYKASLTEALII